MLVTLRHEKMERSQNPRKISRHNRSSAHDEESARRRSRTFSQDDTAVPNDPDSKNVYYENQLSKKDYDIQELRFVIYLTIIKKNLACKIISTRKTKCKKIFAIILIMPLVVWILQIVVSPMWNLLT